MMRPLFIVLCGWLLPLLAVADAASGVSLQVLEASYRPGDVVELQAQMRRAEYAEFELHVPAHDQLHFVAHTREPVRYVGGEYVQRVILLLQPMRAGAFELNAITATLLQGEQVTEVALPPVQFSVESYATEDASTQAAVLGVDVSELAQQSNLVAAVGVIAVAFILLVLIARLFMRNRNTQSLGQAVIEVSLSDLIVALQAGESSATLMEQLLERSDLTLSPDLREAFESAVYADRINVAVLIQKIKEELSR